MLYGSTFTETPVSIESEAYAVMLGMAWRTTRERGEKLLPGPPARTTYINKSGHAIAMYRWPVVRTHISPKMIAGHMPPAERTCGHGKQTRYNFAIPPGYCRHVDGTDCDIVTLMQEPS